MIEYIQGVSTVYLENKKKKIPGSWDVNYENFLNWDKVGEKGLSSLHVNQGPSEEEVLETMIVLHKICIFIFFLLLL